MQEIILKYARLGIYIEVMADCFNFATDRNAPSEQQVCWRPYVNWLQDGEWTSNDCGCHSDLNVTMADAAALAQDVFETVYGGVALNYQNVPPFKFPTFEE